MPASVAPSMPPSIQMPVADPMQRGSTQRCMTNGPLAMMATKPRPSRARRASSMGAALANAEAKAARLARNAAPTMSLFAPTRPARPPTGGDNPDEREHRHEPRSAAGIHRELVHDAFHDGGYLVLDNRHGQRDQHERQRHPRIVPARAVFAPHGRPPRASWPNWEAAGPPASRVPRAFPAPPAASALPEHRARRECPAWGALRPGAGRRRTRNTSLRPRHRLRRMQGRSCRGRPWLV